MPWGEAAQDFQKDAQESQHLGKCVLGASVIPRMWLFPLKLL